MPAAGIDLHRDGPRRSVASNDHPFPARPLLRRAIVAGGGEGDAPIRSAHVGQPDADGRRLRLPPRRHDRIDGPVRRIDGNLVVPPDRVPSSGRKHPRLDLFLRRSSCASWRASPRISLTRARLANRVRRQPWRYYPQFISLGHDLAEPWLLELWRIAPTPQHAQQLSQARVELLLKRYRIRRIDASSARDTLRAASTIASSRLLRRLRRTATTTASRPRSRRAPGRAELHFAATRSKAPRERLCAMALLESHGRCFTTARNVSRCHVQQSATKVDRHGRVVIPAEYRRALGLQEGDAVMIRLDDGALRIVTRPEAIRRAQELVTRRTSGERSLVDELTAERRAEAAGE